MYLEVLGRKMVILDTLEVANDLLEKRSSIYSCRPEFVVFNMMGWDRSLVLLQYISKTRIFTGEDPFIWDISGARYLIPETSGDLWRKLTVFLTAVKLQRSLETSSENTGFADVSIK